MANNNKKLNFTPEQEAAISYRGGALLVSAAAGSGKTRVLVERLLGHVEEHNNIDDFLVITYTRAAAAELRERIHDEISVRLADSLGGLSVAGGHMWRQLMLCRNAQIGTIHSFCTDILRENAHLAGLMPDFRVTDESENAVIKASVLEDVLDHAYENINTSEGLRNLVDSISPGRDDRRLFDIILEAHAKLMSCPDLSDWVARQVKLLELDDVRDVADTVWGDYLIERADKTARFWHGEIGLLRREMESYPDFYAAYGNSIEQTVHSLGEFISALSIGWNEARDCGKIEFPRPKKNIKEYDEFKDVRKRCKKAMDKCTSIFEYSSDELIEDMRAIAPELTMLLKLVMDFNRAFSSEKFRRGVVDFSDLEHLCLSLLVDKETGEKTALARSVSGRYKEILVDEYQDVNAVQEMIMNAVSQDGNNVFMVGDVKQSIYRFRLADPSIFLGKYGRFEEFDLKLVGNAELDEECRGDLWSSVSREDGCNPECDFSGVKIHLSKNFRSRAGVLDAVNQVFASVMSVEFGEMDYTENEYLIAGRQGERREERGERREKREERREERGERREKRGERREERGKRKGENGVVLSSVVGDAALGVSFDAEINVIDLSALESDDDESVSKIQAEARFIAGRIKALVNGEHCIVDKSGAKCAVRYSDIVILLRSMRDRAWQYASALMEFDIPSDMPGGEGFYKTIEVSAALSLLMVVDNPMQDIPLAAALRGPAYGFSADELAEIRACLPENDFYAALVKASEANEKYAKFLKDIDSLRALTPDMPADRFIWHMYNKTGLLARVGAMRHGERRRENLILLAENARSLEQNGYKGLFGFLTYVRGQQERGLEPIREVSLSEQNAVKIMSIHKSKGLEFPVVFLAGTTSKINNKDALQPLLIHSEFGIGTKRTDLERRIKFTTLSRNAIQSKLTLENMAEELRVLYVAMTRAKEKLYIVATFNNAEKEMDKYTNLVYGARTWGARSGESTNSGLREYVKIPPQILMEVNNMAGWVLLSALANENSELSSFVIESDSEAIQNQQLGMERGERRERKEERGERREENGERRMENGVVSSFFVGDAALGVPLVGNAELCVDYLAELKKRFEFAYPFKNAPDMPSKLTVTELKGKLSNIEMDEEAASVARAEKSMSGSSLKYAFERPEFIVRKTGLTAAERGTALHLAMQYIEFEACGSMLGIEREIKRLFDKGLLTTEQSDAVDTTKIMRFFESDIGKRLFQAQDVRREFKFSLLYDAVRFFPDYKPGLTDDSDKILVQGVIDCFFEENGELVVLDFKTDYVTEETIDEKAAEYKQQITAYADALGRITEKKVKERVIYFFTLDKECII